jgi:predicted RNase H-like HicB family nuclease
MPKVLNYRVIIEKDEDGVYVASVPSIRGCYTEGDTYEEVLKNIKEAICLCIEAEKDKKLLFMDDSKTEFVGTKDVTINYGSFTCS